MRANHALTLALTLSLALAGSALAADPILVGGIFDTSGATADVGKDYAVGCRDAAAFINANGGVNGRPIELLANDYAYKPDAAVNLYKTYKDKGVAIIQGWGTGDTNALKALVNKDKIVYISASYDSGLNDPKTHPYNFYVGASYGEGIRAAMQFIKEGWTDKTRPPKVVFIYPDHPYGKNPIPAGKEMAKELGIAVGPDQTVALNAIEANSQLMGVQKAEADWAWLGGTSASCAVVLKDAAKLGLKTKFIANVWGFNENVLKLAAEAANDRHYGIAPFAFYGDDVPGMKKLVESHQKLHAGDAHTVPYVQGWAAMMVMWEGLKRAKALDGPGIKAALETLKDFDTGGLVAAPVTFTPADHRPNTTVGIKRVDASGKVATVKTVTLERKAEWLGQ